MQRNITANEFISITSKLQLPEDKWFSVTDEKLKANIWREKTKLPITSLHPMVMPGDSLYIGFAKGSRDAWAAPLVHERMDGTKRITFPTDFWYFNIALFLDVMFPEQCVFEDFMWLANMIGGDSILGRYGTVPSETKEDIRRMCANKYKGYEDIAFNMFMHLLYGMIAEEHWARLKNGHLQHTRIGRKPKVIALYEILVEGKDVDVSAKELHNVGVDMIDTMFHSINIPLKPVSNGYRSEYDEPKYHPLYPKKKLSWNHNCNAEE